MAPVLGLRRAAPELSPRLYAFAPSGLTIYHQPPRRTDRQVNHHKSDVRPIGILRLTS